MDQNGDTTPKMETTCRRHRHRHHHHHHHRHRHRHRHHHRHHHHRHRHHHHHHHHHFFLPEPAWTVAVAVTPESALVGFSQLSGQCFRQFLPLDARGWPLVLRAADVSSQRPLQALRHLPPAGRQGAGHLDQRLEGANGLGLGQVVDFQMTCGDFLSHSTPKSSCR